MTFNTANNVYHTREGEVWLNEPGSDEKHIRALNREVSLESVENSRNAFLWSLLPLAALGTLLAYSLSNSAVVGTIFAGITLALFWPLTFALLFSWMRARRHRESKVRATVEARTSANIRSGDSLKNAYSVYVLCALQPPPPYNTKWYWKDVRIRNYDFEWYDLDMKLLAGELTPEQERDFKLEVINAIVELHKEGLSEAPYLPIREALVRRVEYEFLCSQLQHVEDLARQQVAEATELARQRELLEQVRTSQIT